MKEAVKKVLPMDLQFFAGIGEEEEKPDADERDSESSGSEGGSEEDSTGGNNETSAGEKDSGKTFTQVEVAAMMSKEKKEGRRALLKQLGFKSEAEAKDAIALYNALVESQKTDDQKRQEAAAGIEAAKAEAEERAEAAEAKLACVVAGVKKDALDDALALAKLKVTEEKNLDKVLAEMKKEPRYASFFGEEDTKGDGTGQEPGHHKNGKGTKKGAYGSKLAADMYGSTKKESQAASSKKSYF